MDEVAHKISLLDPELKRCVLQLSADGPGILFPHQSGELDLLSLTRTEAGYGRASRVSVLTALGADVARVIKAEERKGGI